MHYKLPMMEEKGFVVLKDYDGPPIPEQEFRSLDFIDWKSGGDTNFAPIASALGEMECGGFWDHGKPDKDGVWTSNRSNCPTLVDYVESVGARFGRVRVIKLNPYDSEQAALRQLHLDVLRNELARLRRTLAIGAERHLTREHRGGGAAARLE